MTKPSDARWEFERKRLHAQRFAMERFGMWHRDGGHGCLCHASIDCRDSRCRAIEHYCNRPHCGPRSRHHGPLYPLWAILYYFQAMIDSESSMAAEFGKRFAHREKAGHG